MRHDFCNHLRVFNCDRKSLLLNGFPVYSAELIHLVNQLLYDGCFNFVIPVWTSNRQLYRKWKPVHIAEPLVFISRVIAEQIAVSFF